MKRTIVLFATVWLCLIAPVLFGADRPRPPIPSDPEIEVVPIAEETRKALDLRSFREKMSGGDEQRAADFDSYFVAPASARAYKEAKGEPLGASPYEDN